MIDPLNLDRWGVGEGREGREAAAIAADDSWRNESPDLVDESGTEEAAEYGRPTLDEQVGMAAAAKFLHEAQQLRRPVGLRCPPDVAAGSLKGGHILGRSVPANSHEHWTLAGSLHELARQREPGLRVEHDPQWGARTAWPRREERIVCDRRADADQDSVDPAT